MPINDLAILHTPSVANPTGDNNLVTGNIKAGANILGVSGKSSVVDTSDALATAVQLLSGASAYVNGIKIAGTMANYNGTNQPAYYAYTSGNSIFINPANTGYYTNGGNSGVYATNANWVASNILSGVSVFGLAGSATIESLGGRKYATGTVTGTTVTVSGLSFTPRMFMVSRSANLAYNAGWIVGFSTMSGSYAVNPTGANSYYLACSFNSTGFSLTIGGTSDTYTYYVWE